MFLIKDQPLQFSHKDTVFLSKVLVAKNSKTLWLFNSIVQHSDVDQTNWEKPQISGTNSKLI